MMLTSILAGSTFFSIALGPMLILWYTTTQLHTRRIEILSLLEPTALERYRKTFFFGDNSRPPRNGLTPDMVLDGLFRRLHSRDQYELGILLIVVPTGLGLAVCATWIHDKLVGIHSQVVEIPFEIIMAFLGGYVWSIYEMLARIHTGDLTARGTVDIAYRVIASVPVGYVFSLVGPDDMTPFFAFAASAFPLRDSRRWFRRITLQKIQDRSMSMPRETPSDRLDHSIVGLSDETLARLEEIHVSTNLDMAYLDPLLLYVETGVPVRTAIDWIDQAIWSLYVGASLRKLQPMGLRSAIEATNLYEDACLGQNGKEKPREEWINHPSIVELAGALGEAYTPTMVGKMLREVSGDPHVALLSALWRGDESDMQ